MNNHSHTHSHSHTHEVKNIKIAFFLNFFFAVIEIIGGIYTNSVSILSDAIHDLGDSISLGTAWYFQHISKKKSDQHYTYGYKRFSILGALITSVVLIVGSVIILSEAIPRLLHPQVTNINGMLILAVIGIIINGAAMFQLRQGKSLNEKVVSLHFLEDVLGWVAVLIGALIMKYYKIPIIDPVLSIFIALFVLKNIYFNLREISRIILQGTPQSIETENLKSEIISLDKNIVAIHDFHLWTVDGNYNVLTTHIVIAEQKPQEELSLLKEKIRDKLHDNNIEHTTIEFEMSNEKCRFENCCE